MSLSTVLLKRYPTSSYTPWKINLCVCTYVCVYARACENIGHETSATLHRKRVPGTYARVVSATVDVENNIFLPAYEKCTRVSCSDAVLPATPPTFEPSDPEDYALPVSLAPSGGSAGWCPGASESFRRPERTTKRRVSTERRVHRLMSWYLWSPSDDPDVSPNAEWYNHDDDDYTCDFNAVVRTNIVLTCFAVKFLIRKFASLWSFSIFVLYYQTAIYTVQPWEHVEILAVPVASTQFNAFSENVNTWIIMSKLTSYCNSYIKYD